MDEYLDMEGTHVGWLCCGQTGCIHMLWICGALAASWRSSWLADPSSQVSGPCMCVVGYHCACSCGHVHFVVTLWLCKGKNFIDQLTLIFDVIGSPQPDEVSHIQNSQAKKYLSSQRGKRPVRVVCMPVCLSTCGSERTALIGSRIHPHTYSLLSMLVWCEMMWCCRFLRKEYSRRVPASSMIF